MDIGVRLRLPNPVAFGESEEKTKWGHRVRAGQNDPRQNYQNFPKFCDLSLKIAPDLKKK